MLTLFYSIHTTGDSGRNLQGWDFVTPDAEEKGLRQQDRWQVVSSLSSFNPGVLEVSEVLEVMLMIAGDDGCG